jgi:preprotein translocase subunit SecG
MSSSSFNLLVMAATDWGRIGTMAVFILFILASVLLVLTVLIQKPQGGGLAGAFGSGAGSGQTAFGARTGDALTVMTIIMFVVFLAGAITLGLLLKPSKPKLEVPAATGTTPAAPVTPASGAATKPAETPATAPTTTTTAPMTTTTTVVPAETPKSEPKPEAPKSETPAPAQTPKTDAPKPADAPKP